MRYLVVVEKGEQSYGAYVPDLPGCIAAGDTKEEVLASFEKPLSFTWKVFGTRGRDSASFVDR